MEIYSNGVKMGSGDGLDFGSAFSVTHNGDIGYVSSATANTTIYTVKKSLTSPQILALNTTPIEVIAAPGAGKVIQLVSAIFSYTYSTAQYATNTTIQLIGDTSDSAIVYLGSLLTATNNLIQHVPIQEGDIVANKSLLVSVQTGDPTDGGGTVDVYVTYQIITL